MKPTFNYKTYLLLSGLTAVLLLITAIAGLLMPGTYVGFVTPLHIAESQGQDATTLLIGLPLLALSIWWTRRGDRRGPIFWAGAMGYFLYVYLIYAYGGVYNACFLAYVVVCGLSLWTLIGLLLGIDPSRATAAHLSTRMRRAIALYFGLTALILTLMWGAMAYEGMVLRRAADANVIIVTDLMVVIPAYVLSAVWLWQKRAWSAVLAGVLLVQAVTLGASIVAGQIIALLKGISPSWGLAAFFGMFATLGLILATGYVKAMKD